jgi:glycosyltransferase involved in cell wall biosynthesis
MNDTFLSVVVPVFNGKKYIKATLESLLRVAEKKDIEIIIQDALSTDGTSEIIEDYAKKFKKFFHYREKDLGQSDAINKGIQKSTGKWVTWLCADDLLLDGIIDMLNEVKDENDFDVIYGDCIILKDGNIIPAIGTEDYAKGKLSKKRLFIQQPGTCIIRDRWVDNHGLDTKINWIMDYDLFMRLESSGSNFHRFKYFVSVARIHEEAKTSSGSFLRFYEYFNAFKKAHLKNPRFFSMRPYFVYFLEYIIKNVETKKVMEFLKILHIVFWKVAKPAEKEEITKRFNQKKEEIEKNISILENY